MAYNLFDPSKTKLPAKNLREPRKDRLCDNCKTYKQTETTYNSILVGPMIVCIECYNLLTNGNFIQDKTSGRIK